MNNIDREVEKLSCRDQEGGQQARLAYGMMRFTHPKDLNNMLYSTLIYNLLINIDDINK